MGSCSSLGVAVDLLGVVLGLELFCCAFVVFFDFFSWCHPQNCILPWEFVAASAP